MAIVNRNLDATQQMDVYNCTIPTTAAGASVMVNLAMMPYAGTLKAFTVHALGVSGAVVGSLAISRFVAGAGLTTIIVAGASLALVNVGTSGPQAFTLPASSSTLAQVAQGDVVSMLVLAGNNILASQVCLVVKALQDIKSPLGLTS
jgi:hypothetical protein